MTSTSEPKSFRPTREATRRDVLIAAGAGGAVAAGAPFWFKFAHAQEPIRIGFSMALSGGLAGAGSLP